MSQTIKIAEKFPRRKIYVALSFTLSPSRLFSGSAILLCPVQISDRTLAILPQAFSGFTLYAQEYDGIIPRLIHHLLDIHSSSLFINHSTVRRYVICSTETVLKWITEGKKCFFRNLLCRDKYLSSYGPDAPRNECRFSCKVSVVVRL